MKKLLSIIISGLFLTACNSQTNDKAVSEPIEEIPTEPIFTEYNAEDFREIDVNLNKQEGTLPLKYTEYNFNVLAETPKLAKCKKDHVIDTEIEMPEDCPDWYIEDYIKEQQQHIDRLLKLKETSTKGIIFTYSCCGDKFLFIRDYDELCSNSHCFDLCEYDLTTNELSCLFSYDASFDEIGYNLYDMTFINGQLFCSGRYRFEDEYGYGIYTIDTENNRIEKFDCVLDEECKNGYWISNMYSSDRLMVYGYTSIDEDTVNLVEYEYDFEQGVWNNLYSGESDQFPYIFNGSVVNSANDDKRELVCEQDGVFRLKTGLKSAVLRSFSDGKVAVSVKDSINSFLYVFDLEKHERYKYNMSGRGEYYNVYPMGDYLYIDTNLGFVPMLLIPDMGAVFDVKDIMNLNSSFDGEKIWSVMGINGYYDYTEPYMDIYSGDVTIGVLETEE